MGSLGTNLHESTSDGREVFQVGGYRIISPRSLTRSMTRGSTTTEQDAPLQQQPEAHVRMRHPLHVDRQFGAGEVDAQACSPQQNICRRLPCIAMTRPVLLQGRLHGSQRGRACAPGSI